MSNAPQVVVDATVKTPNANQKGRPGFGKAACGVLIVDTDGTEYECSRYLGEMTVPQAEFEGLIFALDQASGLIRRNQHIDVWMDSQLVVKWMTREFKLKQEHIKPLFDKAVDLAHRFESVSYFHHPRTTELAGRADTIARAEYKKHNG